MRHLYWSRCLREYWDNEEDEKMSIRIGILGYGNLGRGVECAVRQNPDMELVAVFTRRETADRDGGGVPGQRSRGVERPD